MKKLRNRLVIQVTAKDLKKGDFVDPDRCPLALAVKRRYPDREIFVGLWDVDIDDETFEFDYVINDKLDNLNSLFDGKPFKVELIKK